MAKRGRPKGSKNGTGKRRRRTTAGSVATRGSATVDVQKRHADVIGGKSLSETNLVAMELLVAFCRFLRGRVVTMNLDLMEKMVYEYFNDYQDTTLQEFVELGANLVAVLPIDIKDPKERAVAAEWLAASVGVRKTAASAQIRADGADTASSFFTMLGLRVDTRRMELLLEFFREFTQHRDTATQVFVASGSCAVSILPCAILSAAPTMTVATDRTMEAAKGEVVPPSISPHARKRKLRAPVTDTPGIEAKRVRRGSSPTFDDVMVESVEFDDENQVVLKCQARATDIDALKEEVMARMKVLESRAPWKTAYSNMPLPFDEDEAPALADRLRRFWVDNARAIWERNFWSPLTKFHPMFEQRKQRQRCVVSQFNQVLDLAYERFGAEFFVKLDQKPHDGWWYRRPLMEVVLLRETVGAKACWEMVEQAVNVPHPFRNLYLPLRELPHVQRQHSSWSRALWSKSWANFDRVLREMKEIKTRTDMDAQLEE